MKAYRRRARLAAIGSAVLASVMAIASTAFAVAGDGGDVSATMRAHRAAEPRSVDGNPGFMQVRTDGTLYYYEYAGSGFTGHLLGNGWDKTTHIATIGGPKKSFVDISNGTLRLWKIVDYKAVFVANLNPEGFGATRLIAGIGDAKKSGYTDLVQVNSAGDLVLWIGGAPTGFYRDYALGYGWSDARLIATALDRAKFVEIKENGELWTWRIGNVANGEYAKGAFTMGGWANVRLLAPAGLDDAFVSIRYDGQMVEWRWNSAINNYQAVPHDWGWENARLVG